MDMKPSFDLVNIESVKDEELDAYLDRTIFQTRQWVNFIAYTQIAAPSWLPCDRAVAHGNILRD